MLEPQYSISNRMVRLVADAEAAALLFEYFLGRGMKLTDEVNKRKMAQIYYGNIVENEKLKEVDVERVLLHKPERDEDIGVLAEELKGSENRDVIQRIVNYANANRYLDKFSKENIKNRRLAYKKEWLLELHALVTEKLLAPHEVGVLRKTQVVVRGVSGGEIVFRPPNVVEVEYQLDDLLNYVNQFRQMQVHPLLAAGVAYYELMRIHPFVEGNGVVARLWVRLMLMREGIDRLGLINFEKSYAEKIENYYEVLVRTSERGGELSNWLNFWLEEVMGEIRGIRALCDSGQRGVKLPEPDQVALTERQIRIIDFMRNEKMVGMEQLREVLPEVSDDTILRDLKDLQKKSVVEKKGKTKGVIYVLLE